MIEALSKSLRAYAEKDGRGYPDWAMRYVPIVNRLRPHLTSRTRTLEIGANENGFSRFAETPIIAVDIAFDHLLAARGTQGITPVLADIRNLPFRNDEFDVVVCIDTFEHLSPDHRREAAQEIGRALAPQGAAAISFPSGEASVRAEERICAAYTQLTGGTIKWLEEHREMSLPIPERVLEDFRQSVEDSHRVTASRNANLRCWEAIWRILMCGWPGRGNAFFQALLRIVTPLLARAHFGTCYRTLIWLEPKDDRP